MFPLPFIKTWVASLDPDVLFDDVHLMIFSIK